MSLLAAAALSLTLVTLEASKHWDGNYARENHDGVGLELNLPDMDLGYLQYQNSYDRESHSVYACGREAAGYGVDICLSMITGYNNPLLLTPSLRYRTGILQLVLVPNAIAWGIYVPLD